MSFTWFVGSRYLRTRQKQAFISLITFLATAGIAVGATEVQLNLIASRFLELPKE